MENTRTDYADMGKILSGPSTSFLGDKTNRLFGTISGTTFGPILDHIWIILDHIWHILTIFDLSYLVLGRGRPPGPYRLRLGRGRPPGPPSDSQGVFPKGFVCWKCVLCVFSKKLSLWAVLFTNLYTSRGVRHDKEFNRPKIRNLTGLKNNNWVLDIHLPSAFPPPCRATPTATR